MEPASRFMRKLPFFGDTINSETLVCSAWAKAVGKTIAAYTRASKLVRSKLVVEVEDATWQRQLFSLQHQIRRKLEQNIGPGIVDEIEFRVVPRRLGPRRAERVRAASADDADRIEDPVLREIYKTSRKKALA